MSMSTTKYENVTVATRIEEKSKSHSSMAKAVLAGSVGNALEWFDYGIYGYFASIISSEFFASKDPITALMLSFIVFGVGFVMRPIGGLIFGHYADKVGRRAVLTWTIVLMGISTFLVGCIPSYVTIGIWAPIFLTLCRLLQGISTGGEWGSCMSFLAEYATPYNRGYIVSWSEFSIAGECKIVCVNRYCMNLLYAPYWGKQR